MKKSDILHLKSIVISSVVKSITENFFPLNYGFVFKADSPFIYLLFFKKLDEAQSFIDFLVYPRLLKFTHSLPLKGLLSDEPKGLCLLNIRILRPVVRETTMLISIW